MGRHTVFEYLFFPTFLWLILIRVQLYQADDIFNRVFDSFGCEEEEYAEAEPEPTVIDCWGHGSHVMPVSCCLEASCQVTFGISALNRTNEIATSHIDVGGVCWLGSATSASYGRPAPPAPTWKLECRGKVSDRTT